MSDSEAIMWAVEKDPALRSDFCNLTLLDSTPDPDRLREKIGDALRGIPRLGQRVVSAPLRIVPPEWVDDPDLDIGYHVRRVAAPKPGGVRELLDLCAALGESPFDRSRPLWEFTVIDGLAGGRTALLQKMHHTITDGGGALGDAVGRHLPATRTVAAPAGHAVTHPAEAPGSALDALRMAGSLRRQL